MLDFILKPGGKLEYYENASLSKFEGNSSIDMHLPKIVLEIRLCPKDLTGSKALLPTTRTSNFDPRGQNDVNVCKQISSLYLTLN